MYQDLLEEIVIVSLLLCVLILFMERTVERALDIDHVIVEFSNGWKKCITKIT